MTTVTTYIIYVMWTRSWESNVSHSFQHVRVSRFSQKHQSFGVIRHENFLDRSIWMVATSWSYCDTLRVIHRWATHNLCWSHSARFSIHLWMPRLQVAIENAGQSSLRIMHESETVCQMHALTAFHRVIRFEMDCSELVFGSLYIHVLFMRSVCRHWCRTFT